MLLYSNCYCCNNIHYTPWKTVIQILAHPSSTYGWIHKRYAKAYRGTASMLLKLACAAPVPHHTIHDLYGRSSKALRKKANLLTAYDMRWQHFIIHRAHDRSFYKQLSDVLPRKKKWKKKNSKFTLLLPILLLLSVIEQNSSSIHCLYVHIAHPFTG